MAAIFAGNIMGKRSRPPKGWRPSRPARAGRHLSPAQLAALSRAMMGNKNAKKFGGAKGHAVRVMAIKGKKVATPTKTVGPRRVVHYQDAQRLLIAKRLARR